MEDHAAQDQTRKVAFVVSWEVVPGRIARLTPGVEGSTRVVLEVHAQVPLSLVAGWAKAQVLDEVKAQYPKRAVEITGCVVEVDRAGSL